MKKQLDYYTKRKISIGVLVFFAITFLCLITNLFGFYKTFLVGTFGLLIYPAVLLGIVGCILYLCNVVISFDKKMLTLCLVVLGLFLCILQTALTAGISFESFGAFIGCTYLSGLTPAGIIFSIIIYPFKYLLFDVGTYVVFAIAIIATALSIVDYSYTKSHSNDKRLGANLSKREEPKVNDEQGEKIYLRQVEQNEQAESEQIKQPAVENKMTDDEKRKKIIKAKLGLTPQDEDIEQENDTQEESEELKGKSDSFKTLYADKYKKTKNEPTKTQNNINLINRESPEYKETYKEYTTQKVEYINDAIQDKENLERACKDIINGDKYTRNNIFSESDRKKNESIINELKEEIKPTRKFVEKRIGDGLIVKAIETFENEQPSASSYKNEEVLNSNDFETTNPQNIDNDITKSETGAEEMQDAVLNDDYDKPILQVNEEDEVNDESESIVETFDNDNEQFDDLNNENDNNQFNEETTNKENINHYSEIPFSSKEVKISFGACNTNAMPHNQSNENATFTSNSHAENTEKPSLYDNLKMEQKEQDEEIYIAPKPYNRPPVEFLTVESTDMSEIAENTEQKSTILESLLESFKVPAKVTNIVIGPSVTRYEMTMPAGISVKRIVGYADDIAMALEAKGAIRIEAPIPGKNAVGIEVPNGKSATIGFKDVFENPDFIANKNPLNFVLGKDINGKDIFCNLAKAPHLLVAGSTGSGKSVCLNILILSIIYRCSPEDVRLVLIDPKRVEFSVYEGLPHLMLPHVITEANKVVNAFTWAINEMERRYSLLQANKVRDIGEYNSLPDIVGKVKPKMPYIVIIMDELADFMESNKKEIEGKIARLAAKARSAGIHLVLATQRPSIDVITGTIKNNLPTRIAFALTSFNDSRTILDQGGAEKLLGKGDMLYSPQGQNEPTRIQAPFVTINEISNIVDYVKANNEARFDEKIINKMLNKSGEPHAVGVKDPTEDEMFLPALKASIECGGASASLFQRKLGVGWNRAAKLTDALEEMGYISASENGKQRKVLITMEQFINLYGDI